MKRSDTLFRHKAALLYDIGASIREMAYLITTKIGSPVIDFRTFEEMGVCERVGTWIMDNDGETGVWGRFTILQRNAGNKDIFFVAQDDDRDDACFYRREEEMYDYTLDELIYLHDEIEKIYKFVKKNK